MIKNIIFYLLFIIFHLFIFHLRSYVAYEYKTYKLFNINIIFFAKNINGTILSFHVSHNINSIVKLVLYDKQ